MRTVVKPIFKEMDSSKIHENCHHIISSTNTRLQAMLQVLKLLNIACGVCICVCICMCMSVAFRARSSRALGTGSVSSYPSYGRRAFFIMRRSARCSTDIEIAMSGRVERLVRGAGRHAEGQPFHTINLLTVEHQTFGHSIVALSRSQTAESWQMSGMTTCPSYGQ